MKKYFSGLLAIAVAVALSAHVKNQQRVVLRYIPTEVSWYDIVNPASYDEGIPTDCEGFGSVPCGFEIPFSNEMEFILYLQDVYAFDQQGGVEYIKYGLPEYSGYKSDGEE